MVGVKNKQHYTLSVYEDDANGLAMVYKRDDGSDWCRCWDNDDELSDAYIYRAARCFTKIVEHDLDPIENGFESDVFNFVAFAGEVAYYDSDLAGEIWNCYDRCGYAAQRFLENVVGGEKE